MKKNLLRISLPLHVFSGKHLIISQGNMSPLIVQAKRKEQTKKEKRRQRETLFLFPYSCLVLWFTLLFSIKYLNFH